MSITKFQFFNLKLHQQVLALAIPMVLSNITVPLLGLVDTGIIGHLDHPWYLGGVALGSTLISLSFWLLGFLRMATTGLAAQAQGGQNKTALVKVLRQGLVMAALLASLLLALQVPILSLSFHLSDASEAVKTQADIYFSIRIWSAPFALANYVFLGWLLGTQNAKAPMWMVIASNLTNIIFDFIFVLGLGLGVAGVAFASVLADICGFAVAVFFVSKTFQRLALPSLKIKLNQVFDGVSRLLKLNRDIFLRSLCLQAVFTFMTFQGAAFGDNLVAANAVLMSFLMLISYGMDGFAYAMEAMVGQAFGAKSKTALIESLVGTSFWGLMLSLILTLVFIFFGGDLISLMTDIEKVAQTADIYLIYMILMPLISMWCFLLDGIFIGATKAGAMRNTVFVAACSFFAVFYLFVDYQNHALWAAMLVFMFMRGLGLGVVLYIQWRAQRFFETASD